MNKTDEPTLTKKKNKQEANIQVNVLRVAIHEKFPTMYNDNDSVSLLTQHPGHYFNFSPTIVRLYPKNSFTTNWLSSSHGKQLNSYGC
jgi:hypothetical protein